MIVNHRLARQGRNWKKIIPFPTGNKQRRISRSCWILQYLVGLFFVLCVVPDAYARDFSAADRALNAETKRLSPAALIVVEAKSARRVYEFVSSRLIGKNLFSPGSLAKPWAANVLLNHAAEFKFHPDRPYRCSGRFYPDRYFAMTPADRRTLNFRADTAGREYLPCSRSSGHGSIGLTEALAHSCNAYFLTAVAGRPRLFYKRFLEEWALDTNRFGEPEVVTETPGLPLLSLARTVASSRVSPLLAASAAIGEGGAVRISPARAAQMFLALNNGGRLLALQGDADRPRLIRRLRFPSQDLDRIRFALGRTAMTGTLSGFSRELASDHGAAFQIYAAKTGSATPTGRRYGTHGWLAMHFRAVSRKEYVLVAFLNTGNGGRDARRFTRLALTHLEPLL